ncbi:hypothetical protein C8J55DRAFT_572861 [Lentinula edodes]|uniref:Uncharacterized protein n=1 Tax=Lentinula lateritia TaxID=40482 RepID=A0A9W9DRJ9_9AGAR|nr:hypothetical protein C8J55DRAFT_572861 [Lentinula edodes]
MRISVEDVDFADPLINIPFAVALIEDALCDEGIVLVDYVEGCDCHRSLLRTLIYLIVVIHPQRVNARQALQMVREGREQIGPNPGF